MKPYLLNIWDSVRTSYWFVPSICAAAAAILALALPALDAAIAASRVTLPAWIVTSGATARSTLSTVAGAMIAVTGTVFSITVVTLSLTSQQFGPRLLRRFMYDFATQLTLGIFVATGTYCLLLLPAIEGDDGQAAVPHLSVLASVALALVCMFALIFFIHRVATLIQAPQVVAAVAYDLEQAIDRLFPVEVDGRRSESTELERRLEAEQESLGEADETIHSRQTGYIQSVDTHRLVEFASEVNRIVRLLARPGDFIGVDSPLAELWYADASASDRSKQEDVEAVVNDAIIVGVRRTPRQDVECAVEELVEVAVRSLSPGINDPFTAINSIDHLGACLRRIAGREIPSDMWADESGALRLIGRSNSFTGVIDSAFNQIRQHGRVSVAVTIRLLDTLCFIGDKVGCPEDFAALQRQGKMIRDHADGFSDEYDKKEVADRFQRLKQIVDEGKRRLTQSDPNA